MKPDHLREVKLEKPSLSSEISAAQIAIIGSAVVALGQAIGVFAEVRALEELSNDNSQDQLSLGPIQRQLNTIQKQLDYLTREASKKH
ncbi:MULTISPECIES: hypothetical protein [Bacillaceae]|uniref:Translation initiation factor 2 n=1 Tax=Domibacillus aminovorans TaxID=29332 RepID=A0A177KX53_9BACI|nr:MULTISPECIES: hypothetical protein [Bacillaceae]OAH57757.1 hypothetical protein AWH48_01690 [Domibacillus aminovorans]